MEVKIASVNDIPAGEMKAVESNGKSIVIANLKGKYYAIGNVCTHMGCSLSDGTLNGKKIECPCHGSTFDVTTGAIVQGPAKEPEPSYTLRIDRDQILLIS